jgi:large subunit ribosomal protein L23
MKNILYILNTEKANNIIDGQNKLTFIVKLNASKKDVKTEVEKEFNAKVKKITTCVSMSGEKKAVVRFEKAGEAANIASKMKVV